MKEYTAPSDTLPPRHGGVRHAGHTVLLALTAAVIPLCLICFLAGINYQKAHQSDSQASQTAASRFGQYGQYSQRGGARRAGGQTGTVTAASANSITIRTNNDTKTYAITSTTAVSHNKQTVDAHALSAGQKVTVEADRADMTKAARITIESTTDSGNGTDSQGTADPTPSDVQTD